MVAAYLSLPLTSAERELERKIGLLQQKRDVS